MTKIVLALALTFLAFAPTAEAGWTGIHGSGVTFWSDSNGNNVTCIHGSGVSFCD